MRFVGTAMPDRAAHAVDERRVVGSLTATRAAAQRIGKPGDSTHQALEEFSVLVRSAGAESVTATLATRSGMTNEVAGDTKT